MPQAASFFDALDREIAQEFDLAINEAACIVTEVLREVLLLEQDKRAAKRSSRSTTMAQTARSRGLAKTWVARRIRALAPSRDSDGGPSRR